LMGLGLIPASVFSDILPSGDLAGNDPTLPSAVSWLWISVTLAPQRRITTGTVNRVSIHAAHQKNALRNNGYLQPSNRNKCGRVARACALSGQSAKAPRLPFVLTALGERMPRRGTYRPSAVALPQSLIPGPVALIRFQNRTPVTEQDSMGPGKGVQGAFGRSRGFSGCSGCIAPPASLGP